MLAGAAVLMLAGLATVALTALERPGAAARLDASAANATEAPAPDVPSPYLTANLRRQPDPAADLVAVVPAGHAVELRGRTTDGAWLHIAYPPGSTIVGWLPAERLRLPPGATSVLEVAAAGAPPEDGAPSAPAVGLPDLVIAAVTVLDDGRMAVDLRNEGDGPLVESEIPLHVTRASGEIVGVLEIGPTTLPSGATATVVTPVRVVSTGTYLLQIDRADTIRESSESNNSFSAVLLAGGS